MGNAPACFSSFVTFVPFVVISEFQNNRQYSHATLAYHLFGERFENSPVDTIRRTTPRARLISHFRPQSLSRLLFSQSSNASVRLFPARPRSAQPPLGRVRGSSPRSRSPVARHG